MDDTSLQGLVSQLARLLTKRCEMMATVESCTGGLISASCTSISGSSDWFERGFVTYSNEAKSTLVGVDPAIIDAHGAVSEPVARAMADGGLRHAPVQWSVAVTGIAGPTGGSAEKPVGTVWFAWGTPTGVETEVRVFGGDRASVRAATAAHALQGLLERIEDA
ncbi:CinA family protein [Hydrogenophaga sp. 5NK40-0174]|uniref:CinA family protein n=1 Tax=Hydrogenophaga sp. 5NK40-0174 TaxID=3127649 RepID=UPI00310ADECE